MPPKEIRKSTSPLTQQELATIANLLKSESGKQEGLDLLASKGGIAAVYGCHSQYALRGAQLARSKENVLHVLAALPGGINFKDPEIGTWLEQAVWTYREHIVARALELGADPNSTRQNGEAVITMILDAKPASVAEEDTLANIFKQLLDAGANPNTVIEIKTTLVEQLALVKSSFRLKLLTILCQHKNLRITGENDGKSFSAVYAAVEQDNIKALKLLLGCGADPTVLGPSGHSPLIHAIDKLHWDSVRELINNQVSVNEESLFSGTQMTPLMSVLHVMTVEKATQQTQERGRDIIKLLLTKNADPFKQTTTVTSAIGYAIFYNRIDCLELFANAGCKFDRPVTGSTSALLFALNSRCFPAANWLLAQGVDSKTGDEEKVTPLLVASRLGNPDIFQKILQRNLDQVNTPDANGRTPLSLAAASGNTYIVKRLLQVGADARYTNPDKQTALIVATTHNQPDCVRLLARVSDVNAQVTDGATALFFAAQEGRLALCKLLVELGAKPDLARYNGDTCFEIANEEKHMDVVSYLLQLQLQKDDDSIVECTIIDRIVLSNSLIALVYIDNSRPKTEVEKTRETNLFRLKFADISEKDALTGLEYLRQQGLSVADINDLRQPAEATTSPDVTTTPAPIPCNWFKTLSRDDARIRPIEGMFTSDNCYLIIDEAALAAQNCVDLDAFIHAGKKFAARIGEAGIVSLRGDQLTVAVTINGSTETKILTDEIKIKKGPERILCFREKGSNGRSTLLVGCVFAPLGLHQHSHNSRLSQAVTLSLTQQESPQQAHNALPK